MLVAGFSVHSRNKTLKSFLFVTRSYDRNTQALLTPSCGNNMIIRYHVHVAYQCKLLCMSCVWSWHMIRWHVQFLLSHTRLIHTCHSCTKISMHRVWGRGLLLMKMIVHCHPGPSTLIAFFAFFQSLNKHGLGGFVFVFVFVFVLFHLLVWVGGCVGVGVYGYVHK